MGWTRYQVLIAVVLIVTGSINTLSVKWADRMKAKYSDGKTRKFHHPFLQACCMFIGEMLCLLVFKSVYCYYSRKENVSLEDVHLLKGSRSFHPIVLLPPAVCDMVATSIMYVGLTLTHASSFQMFRGSVIVFVGIFSIIFLKRRLKIREWVGIFVVIAGLVVVGLSDEFAPRESDRPLHSNTTNNRTKTHTAANSKSLNVLGDALIIGAQIIVATQMVLEEKYVSSQDIPALEAVGWEGLFGFVILGLLLIPICYIKVAPPFSNNPRDTLEDVGGAFVQMGNNPVIICSLTGVIFSIAFFNFAGITVTKEMSATTRMILDSVRTLFIYLVSLALRWQSFFWVQIPGFTLLVLGMAVYNNLFSPCVEWFQTRKGRVEESDEPERASD